MKWKELADLICNMAIYVDGNLDCRELKELDNIVSVSGNRVVTKFGEFIVAGNDGSSLMLVVPSEYLEPREIGLQDAMAIMMVPVDDQAVASIESVRGRREAHFSVGPVQSGTIYIAMVVSNSYSSTIAGIWDSSNWWAHVEQTLSNMHDALLGVPHSVDKHIVEDAAAGKPDDTI